MKHPSDSDMQKIIWQFYSEHRRQFPWREHISPYRVVVSEIMLQQTQTHRVLPKFSDFISTFPSFADLAHAPFSEVLRLWKGLGYNRRALNLHRLATMVMDDYGGELPTNIAQLGQLPGIGKATARSIYAFTYNEPCVFIETNIRTVFIHFYFQKRCDVHDKEILPLIESTLPPVDIRDWYYALMDYGAMLKATVGNLNHQSIHYKKQSRFQGSDRQLRGQILQKLLEQRRMSHEDVLHEFASESSRLSKIIDNLCDEGLIKNDENGYFL